MFANAWLLAFLPLAALPILLHLLTLYKLKTVELSTYRFLMDSYFKQRRRLKLLEWLLMFLRVLFVAMIIFIVSRPVIEQFQWLFVGDSGRDVMIVIDSGAAMNMRTGGTTSLERAKASAKAVVKQLARRGEDDHITVIRAGKKPAAIARGFANTPQQLLDQIDSIEADPTTANITGALDLINTTETRGARIIYLYSDLQRYAWNPVQAHPALEEIDATTQLIVMDVGPDQPVENTAISGDPPRALRPIAGLPVLLSANVRNTSTTEAVNTILAVIVDEQQVAQFSLALQPGERITQPIIVTPTKPGVVRGRFELPPDMFPDDDQFHFALNVAEHLNVLLIAGPRADKVAERSDIYVRTAIKAPLDVQDNTIDQEKRIAETISLTQIRQEELHESRLKQADVVILADVQLNDTRNTALKEYVEDGGGLLILPGAHSNHDPYNKLLEPTTIKLAAPVGNPDDETRFLPITSIDLTHAVLSAFDDEDEETEYFSTTRIYRHFPIQFSDKKTDDKRKLAWSLMRFPNRVPLMVESYMGQGKIIVLGLPASPAWSNLPLKPEFVPMLLRTVAYLRRPVQVEIAGAVRPYEPAPISITANWSKPQVQVTDPENRQHTIDIHRNNNQREGALLETNRTGLYTFNVTPNAPGAKPNLELGFAVNLDTNHADFRTLDEPAIKTLFAPLEPTYLAATSDDPIIIEQLTEKNEIWRILIWVTFAIIAIEFLLSTLSPAVRKKQAQNDTDFVEAATLAQSKTSESPGIKTVS